MNENHTRRKFKELDWIVKHESVINFSNFEMRLKTINEKIDKNYFRFGDLSSFKI